MNDENSGVKRTKLQSIYFQDFTAFILYFLGKHVMT